MMVKMQSFTITVCYQKPHCRQVYLLKNKARELNGPVTNRVGFNDELARFSENLFNPFGVAK